MSFPTMARNSLALIAIALLPGCGSGSDRTTAPATTGAAPSTAAAASAPSSTTTPSDPPTTTTARSPRSSAAPAPTAAGTAGAPRPGSKTPGSTSTTTVDLGAAAGGSGCAPGSTALPDGVWFGFVSEPTGTGFSLDVACWFVGLPAAQAAAEDGEESPPPNDFYIRNDNPRRRPVAVAGETQATWTRDTGDPTTEVRTTYSEWLENRAPGIPFGVWVEVQGGVAVQIVEQWVP